jgi:DHA2 family multidrug resistance protein
MNNNYYKGSQLYLLNLALGLGTFIQILDTSIANVAIPYIAGNLSVSVDEGTWIITSFAASNAVMLPLTGWLSDYFGRVRLFVWSIILFSISSLLCGLAINLSMLVFFRVIQGAVAGSLIPLSQSLIDSCNPPEKRGSALGFWGMIVIVAPVLGPIVGGYLTYAYSWPWIFYINLPIGFFSASVVWYYLKERESKIVRAPIDWLGLFLLSLGVASMQIMLDKGKDLDWFESSTIIALTIISIVALTYFAIWSYFQRHPIVDFSFFKNRNFALGTFFTSIGYMVFFGSTVTVPLWLQTQQNYTPLWAGIAVAPVGVIPILFSTTVGKYLHRFDLRLVSSLSFSLFALGFLYQSSFTTEVSLHKVMLARFIQGFGVVLFFLPLAYQTLGEVDKNHYARAAGLFHFLRILIASGFGTSLAIQLWIRLEIFHYSRLTEAFTDYRPSITQLYEHLAEKGNFSRNMITQLLDTQITQQAYMLSTNDLSWLGACTFILMIPMLFLFKRVRQPAIPEAEESMH